MDPDAVLMVSGVGRVMGVLDGGGDRRREGAVLGVNLGRSTVTNGTLRSGSSQITFGRTCFRLFTVRYQIVIVKYRATYCS